MSLVLLEKVRCFAQSRKLKECNFNRRLSEISGGWLCLQKSLHASPFRSSWSARILSLEWIESSHPPTSGGIETFVSEVTRQKFLKLAIEIQCFWLFRQKCFPTSTIQRRRALSLLLLTSAYKQWNSKVPLPSVKLAMTVFVFGFLCRFSQNNCYTLECLSYDINSTCAGKPWPWRIRRWFKLHFPTL